MADAASPLQAQTLVSSNDWLVGYRSEDNLDYVDRNAVRKVHLVAIDPQAKSIKLDGLKAEVIERRLFPCSPSRIRVSTNTNPASRKFPSTSNRCLSRQAASITRFPRTSQAITHW